MVSQCSAEFKSSVWLRMFQSWRVKVGMAKNWHCWTLESVIAFHTRDLDCTASYNYPATSRVPLEGFEWRNLVFVIANNFNLESVFRRFWMVNLVFVIASNFQRNNFDHGATSYRSRSLTGEGVCYVINSVTVLLSMQRCCFSKRLSFVNKILH